MFDKNIFKKLNKIERLFFMWTIFVAITLIVIGLIAMYRSLNAIDTKNLPSFAVLLNSINLINIVITQMIRRKIDRAN